MRLSSRVLRQIAGCLVISSLVACTETGAALAQQVESVATGQAQSRALDNGTQGPEPNTAPSQTPSGRPEAAPPQQPDVPHEPVGIAAAPYEKVTGVPASRPAGAAIAPAKQKGGALDSDQGGPHRSGRRRHWNCGGAVDCQFQ